jgi:acetyltransferase
MAERVLDAPEETWHLNNGLEALLRPLRPTDLPLHRELYDNCSPQSVFQRFFQVIERTKVTDAEVARYTAFDRRRELAIAAVAHPENGPEYGVVRLVNLGGGLAEFALLVADPWQRQGLGRRLLEKAIETAGLHRLDRLRGYVLGNNQPMLRLCRRLGFELHYLNGEGMYEAELALPRSLTSVSP